MPYQRIKIPTGGDKITGNADCSLNVSDQPIIPFIEGDGTGGDIVVKDVIADAFLQQVLLRPAEYNVIATLNLTGVYVSDALAAQVGGIGIAPARTCRTRSRCSKPRTAQRRSMRAKIM